VAKELIKEIGPYVVLYRDPDNGLAWIEDGRNGTGASAHPNIDRTGSVPGMKKRGYWAYSDRTIRSHGFIHNVDVFVAHDILDFVAAEHCGCVGCQSRRKRNPQVDHARRREVILDIATKFVAREIDEPTARERFNLWLDN